MSFRAVETVLDHSQARGSDRLVLVVIAECANHDGEEAWPSIETIGHRAGVSRATVHRAFKRLSALGELHVDYKAGKHGCNRYQVALIQQLELSQSDTVSKRDSRTRDTETVSPVTPEPSSHTSLSNDKEGESLIFKTWCEVMGRNGGTKLNQARRSKIKARLREGYTVEQMIAAVRGAKRDDWIMGRDPHSPRPYNDLTTILRDGAQVERLAALDKPERKRRRRSIPERIRELVAKGVDEESARNQAEYEMSK